MRPITIKKLNFPSKLRVLIIGGNKNGCVCMWKSKLIQTCFMLSQIYLYNTGHTCIMTFERHCFSASTIYMFSFIYEKQGIFVYWFGA